MKNPFILYPLWKKIEKDPKTLSKKKGQKSNEKSGRK